MQCFRCSRPGFLKFSALFTLFAVLLVLGGHYGRFFEPTLEQQLKAGTISDRANAYVFYATEDDYACSVLVNIDILRNSHETKHRIIVLVSNGVSSKYRSAFRALNAEVIREKPMQLHPESNGHYRDCLLKLAAFRMHEIDPTLRRVLVLDSDQLILKDLDHLFDLPSANLYAPTAYWLDDSYLSSTLMLIQPTAELWEEMQEAIRNLTPNQYDMDIVNDVLGEEAARLPDSYIILNNHWEDWTLPPWFTPSATATADSASANPSQAASIQDLDDLSHQAHVIHFTAAGKPWSRDLWTVGELKPYAHEVLLLQWQEWRIRALQLCPAGVIDHL
ncbi:hypothetical protein FZEAL_469 [Fusarium zealandicum]|uniref:Uncharacterized protein n=1 Tax=Fusarium zealandicum TaxID=1053134 RepID=A0A8H4UUM8_9HYPO|nr:hypothetical protein FZEAL_469 [Fusarium zealandicum]